MKKLILVSVLMALAGCTTHVKMVPTSGSKADGIVEMSYEIGGLSKAIVDEQQALRDAKRRCEAWGYKNVEPFGGYRKVCTWPGGLGGCSQWTVTMQYQCLDK